MARSSIDLVGPKGYVHGWIKAGDGGEASKAVKAAPKAGGGSTLDAFKSWRDGLTPAEGKAMRFYQSPGFALMNGQLRGVDAGALKSSEHASDADLARARQASKNLTKAIAKAPPLPLDTTVYRGFDAGQFGALTPGKIITDKGFTSVSVNDDAGAVGRAASRAQATITLPAGTRAAAGSVRELVLPPGSSFKVVSVAKRGGVTHVKLELAPKSGAKMANRGAAVELSVKTPAPERAAGRRKLAAADQALPDGTAPIPDLAYLKKAIRAKGRTDPAKWPALKALIIKRAKQLGATSAPGVKGTWPFEAANDTEAIEMAAATARRIPKIRGAADVQLARTGPGVITAQHKSSGMKIGTIAPAGKGYAGKHADGTGTGSSGSQQGALTGLIAYHNRVAAGFPPAQQGGTAVMPGSKAYANGEQMTLDLADGPAPYHRDPDENVQCPACKKYNDEDARFCDQCGAKLPPEAYESAASLANGARALNLAGSLPVTTPASSSSDGPRVTTAGAGGGSAGLSAYGQQVYAKLIKKGLKPAVAAAFAKRADAMHAKYAAQGPGKKTFVAA